MSLPRVLLSLVVLESLIPISRIMSQSLNIDRTRPCTTCRLQVQSKIRLSLPNNDITRFSVTQTNPTNREYWVAPVGNTGRNIAVFDSNGLYRRTIVGVKNRSFGWIRYARFDPDGRALVHDEDARKIFVLAPDQSSHEEIPMDKELHDIVAFADDNFVANAFIQTSKSVGMPLHIFSRSGEVVRSFGETGGVTEPQTQAVRDRRVIAPAGKNFWAGKVNEYSFDLWSLDGKLLRSIHSSPSWFVPWSRDPIQPADKERPMTILKAIYQDSDGLLWIMFQLPDPKWAKIQAPNTSTDSNKTGSGHVDEKPITTQMRDRLFDTLIEVVDPLNGRLITSRRFDELLLPFFGDRRVTHLLEDESGTKSLEVWKFTIQKLQLRE